MSPPRNKRGGPALGFIHISGKKSCFSQFHFPF
jgi:hypothetical protein